MKAINGGRSTESECSVTRRFSPLAALPLLLPALLMGGCATTTATDAGQQMSIERNVLGDAPFGAYLAGRVAGQLNEMDAAALYYSEALASDPTNQTLLERSFSTSLSNGRFSEALPLAQRLMETGDAPSLAPLLLVLDNVKAERYGPALELAQAMPATGFNTLVGPLVQAWVLQGLGRTDEALTALAKLDSSASFASFQHFHQALILARAGRVDAAEQAFQTTLTVPGGATPRTLLAYGRFLATTGHKDDAVALYDDYIKALPGNPTVEAARASVLAGQDVPVVASPAEGLSDVFFDTAQALDRNGTRSAAIIYAQLANFLMPESDEGRMLLGNLYEASGQDMAAVQAFASVSERSPLHWEAQRDYATMQYRMGNADEARRILESMREKNPDDLTVAITLADVYRRQGEPDKARQIYDAIIGSIKEPKENHWSLYYTRGTTFEELGQWDKAEADLLMALELSPDQPVVLNYLGYSWVVRGENLDRALTMIRKAVELRPNDGNIVDSLGWALYKLGRYDEAVEQLERAVLLRPEVPEINEHLGDAYWRVGRILEARFQWSHAIDLGGDGTNIDILEAKRDTQPGGDPFAHDGD